MRVEPVVKPLRWPKRPVPDGQNDTAGIGACSCSFPSVNASVEPLMPARLEQDSTTFIDMLAPKLPPRFCTVWRFTLNLRPNSTVGDSVTNAHNRSAPHVVTVFVPLTQKESRP